VFSTAVHPLFIFRNYLIRFLTGAFRGFLCVSFVCGLDRFVTEYVLRQLMILAIDFSPETSAGAMWLQWVFELGVRSFTQIHQDVPGRLGCDRRRRVQCLRCVVESGEHSFVFIGIAELLPAPKWANRIVKNRSRLAGTVLAEHLHCAGFEVDVTPPQAVPFLIIRDGNELCATDC